MPIPPLHANRYLYHSTHLKNLLGVLTHGFLSCNEQTRQGLGHTSIASAGIQRRRARMAVPCGPGGVVHDYVPLYFSKLSPMFLLLLKQKNVDQELLLHFAFPIALLNRKDTVFTNAAANTTVPPDFFDDPAHLDGLDWAAIDRAKWGSENDEQKHARMAEALVHNRLDPRQASYLMVWNAGIKNKVLKTYQQAGIAPPPIEYDGHDGYHYFSQFGDGLPKDMVQASLAPGPILTKLHFRDVVEEIKKASGASEPDFASLSDLLTALRSKGLSALPETSELIGLESENEVHKEDVGTHTIKVVEKLRSSKEYRSLGKDARMITEVAAYLHDIGKGPKSRWAGCGGKQKVDHFHPKRSLHMLPRILTQSVAKPDERTVRVLCMLVCYHDLIGDIIGIERDRRQLIGIVEDREELDMLIAVGKADMSAVARSWELKAEAELPELRKWAIEHLGGGDEDDSEDESD